MKATPTYLTLKEQHSLAEKAQSDYLLRGSFDLVGDSVQIDVALLATKNLTSLQTYNGTYPDVLAAADDLSKRIREWLAFDKSLIDKYIDLPLEQYTTANDSALKYYSFPRYETRAFMYDSTMALAALEAAYLVYVFQLTEEGNMHAEYAFKHRDKLPQQAQDVSIFYYHVVKDNRRQALQHLDDLIKIYPDAKAAYLELKSYITSTWDMENAAETWEGWSEKGEDGSVAKEFLIYTYMKNGALAQALQRAKAFQAASARKKDWEVIIGQCHLALFEIDKAKEAFNKYAVLHPDNEAIQQMLAVADFMENTGKEELQRKLEKHAGVHKSSASSITIEQKVYPRFMFYKAQNQSGNPMFLRSDSTLFNYLISQSFELQLTEGGDYLAELSRYDAKGRLLGSGKYYFTTEIEPIEAIVQLLQGQAYGQAKTACEALLAKHPQYWFVEEYLQHIGFMSSAEYQNDRLHLNEVVGDYAADIPRKIVKQGNAYYWVLGGGTKKLIIPLGKNTWRYLNGGNVLLTFERDTNDRIESVSSNAFNLDSMQYESQPRSRYAKVGGAFEGL